MAIPDIISAIGSPLCGWMLDRLAHKTVEKGMKFHWRMVFLPLSAVILLFVHLLMGFTPLNPIFSLSLLGIAYSLFGAALWPMVPILVHNPGLLGTAYGVITVALNIALTVVPLIVARILSASSYFWVEVRIYLSATYSPILTCLDMVRVDFYCWDRVEYYGWCFGLQKPCQCSQIFCCRTSGKRV